MRRTDIDGLRILVCAAVILAHALLIFAGEPRYAVQSVESSQVAAVLFKFIFVSATPLFFTIAGWSAVVSLRRRSPGRFVLERILRLLVPLIAGCVLFGSIIKYIELSGGRDLGLHGFRMVEPLHMNFFEFFYRSLSRLKLMTWSHLWFLAYLFPMSMLLLPLLVRLARSAPRVSVPPAFVVYLPALALMTLMIAFTGPWPPLPTLIGDYYFLYLTLCFAIGAGIAAWPGFEMQLQAEAPRLMVLGLLAFAGLVLSGESQVGRLFVGLTTWACVAASLGFAARFKPAATPTFLYLAEATMPIYIVHHALLLLLGLAVLSLAIPMWLKIALIWSGTVSVSLVAYHCLIRPWPPMRFLMGMAVRPRNALPASQPQPNV